MRFDGTTSLLRRSVRQGIGAAGWLSDRRLLSLRTRMTRGLTVFIFHDITSSPSQHQRLGKSYTSPEVFERQLRWIRQRFTPVSPASLPQIGGTKELPPNAALITFDDAWAGTFRIGCEIARAEGFPALCFINMGTVAGIPDLAAVRRYEAASGHPGLKSYKTPLDVEAGRERINAVCERYKDDAAFLAFQGETATEDDLIAQVGRGVWFGSHLYHHWDMTRISAELFEDSFRVNRDALLQYPNVLDVFATPHGFAGTPTVDVRSIPLRNGAEIVFVATGAQNRDAGARVLDRVPLPPEPSTERDWWYATHRRRLVGRYAN